MLTSQKKFLLGNISDWETSEIEPRFLPNMKAPGLSPSWIDLICSVTLVNKKLLVHKLTLHLYTNKTYHFKKIQKVQVYIKSISREVGIVETSFCKGFSINSMVPNTFLKVQGSTIKSYMYYTVQTDVAIGLISLLIIYHI